MPQRIVCTPLFVAEVRRLAAGGLSPKHICVAMRAAPSTVRKALRLRRMPSGPRSISIELRPWYARPGAPSILSKKFQEYLHSSRAAVRN